LALGFTIFLILTFVIEVIYLGAVMAVPSVIPLIGIIFLLTKKNIYIIEDGTLSIFSDNQKQRVLKIEDLSIFSKYKNLAGQYVLTLIDSNRQKFRIYLGKEDMVEFTSNFLRNCDSF
jgi:hypothetical protein